MSFLRRLFGGDRNGHPATAGADEEAAESGSTDDDERRRELDLARFGQDRTDDLIRRQQRYADRSWTPPRQGGERRAEDNDRTE